MCVRVGDPKQGTLCWYLLAFVEGVDYVRVACFIEAVLSTKSASTIQKSEIKALLSLAQSEREQELIKCSIFKASGLTPTAARRNFGFESMNERSQRLQETIEEARNTRESIDLLAATQDKAILSSMGIVVSDSESDSESDTDIGVSEDAKNTEVSAPRDLTSKDTLPTFECVQQVLESASYNWFEVVEHVEEHTGYENDMPAVKDRFYSHSMSMLQESARTEQSFNATTKPPAGASRMAAILNDEIVSDSESDDASDYLGPVSGASPCVKMIIAKKRKALMLRTCRAKVKAIANANLLAR